jgi:asparagine synthase (glutamine-hydrolysing)
MCGIAGEFLLGERSGPPDLVERVVASQRCRGPDHEGVVRIHKHGSRVVLGHTRLMVVDRSPGSHQPLWDRRGRLCLVFNGEIYNYRELRDELERLGSRFSTSGDSEVILEAFAAWGTGAFERLNGMFAFGLWDEAAETLHLVRDRFGVKPLYYYPLEPGRLCFASTCETLAHGLGLAPDLEYAARGIRYWVYDDEERSPFTGLRAVRPGHGVEIARRDGRLVTAARAFYSLSARVAEQSERLAALDDAQLRLEFARLLERSIDVRMQSDLPIGISLSGGVDSSTLAAVARSRGRVTGFTFADIDDAASEAPMVRALGAQIGLHVHFVRPTMTEIVDAYFEALAAQGAPFPTGSIVGQYLVYRAARREGIKVVLGGQGSDEAFMGYRKFQYFHLRQLLHTRRWREVSGLLGAAWPELASELPRAGSYWRARRRYTRKSGLPVSLRLPPPPPLEMGADPAEPLWVRQAHDIEHTSLPTLLRYEDRNSMAHGVESRLPYLDHTLVEFALGLSVRLKLRDGMRKWIVRDYARGKIPEKIRTSKVKRGFDVAQDRWIERGLGTAIRSALAARRAAIRDYLPTGADPDRLFSDARLKSRTAAFAEATTLIWLADRR